MRCSSRRFLHAGVPRQPIPSPTPFVPDAATFLSLIGRGLSQHASKFDSWASLFSLSGPQLKTLGIEPARSRRYLVWWRDRFRRGIFGPGGDIKNLVDGQAELRVIEVPTNSSGPLKSASDVSAAIPHRVKRMVVNESADRLGQLKPQDLKPIAGMQVSGPRTIAGPFAVHTKGTRGSVAILKRQEGMWEVKRGHKVDGGERRRKEVRRKRAIEQNKAARPA